MFDQRHHRGYPHLFRVWSEAVCSERMVIARCIGPMWHISIGSCDIITIIIIIISVVIIIIIIVSTIIITIIITIMIVSTPSICNML